jgi:hypothetical protein
MLVKVQFNTELELLEYVRGATVREARTGENPAGNPTFTDNTADAFAGVQVDDVLYISGDATAHTVTGVTDDNNIEVSPVIADQHAGPGNFAIYRILRGGKDISGFVFGPVADPTKAGATWGIYDEVDFG